MDVHLLCQNVLDFQKLTSSDATDRGDQWQVAMRMRVVLSEIFCFTHGNKIHVAVTY